MYGKVVKNPHLSETVEAVLFLKFERVALASQLLKRSLLAQTEIVSCASNGRNATRRSMLQMRSRESNFFR